MIRTFLFMNWGNMPVNTETISRCAAENDKYTDEWKQDPLLFHRPRKTWVCLASLSGSGVWQQRWLPTWALASELNKLDVKRDWWISQAEFSDKVRDIAHVAYLQSSFIDLDWKKCSAYISGFLPEPDDPAAVEIIMSRCRAAHIPEPNIIVFSGNGLHLKWVYSGVIPAAALPRWNAVQRELCLRLAAFGADPASLDASRVLRLPCSINGKPGTADRSVRVVFRSQSSYSFDKIADAVLPLPREQLRRAHRSAPDVKKKAVRRCARLGIAALHARRYADILKLIELRRDASGNVRSGRRELMVFWALVCGAHAGTVTAANFDKAARELINLIGSDFALECSTQTFGTLRGILAETDKNTAEKKRSLYRITTKHLIEILDVTQEEQTKMKAIAGACEKARRADVKRRAAGVKPRAVWLAEHAQESSRPWEAENISRRTWFMRKARAAAEAEKRAQFIKDLIAEFLRKRSENSDLSWYAFFLSSITRILKPLISALNAHDDSYRLPILLR